MSNDYFSANNPTNYWAQEANVRARKANDAARESLLKAHVAEKQTEIDTNVIRNLRNKTLEVSEDLEEARRKNASLESERQYFENLLSLPMREIAEKNNDFKKTYEEQQLLLAKWILSQKAYAETAIIIGMEAGKSKKEVEGLYTQSVAAVLTNSTQYENDAISNEVLKENISKIIKRKT